MPPHRICRSQDSTSVCDKPPRTCLGEILPLLHLTKIQNLGDLEQPREMQAPRSRPLTTEAIS